MRSQSCLSGGVSAHLKANGREARSGRRIIHLEVSVRSVDELKKRVKPLIKAIDHSRAYSVTQHKEKVHKAHSWCRRTIDSLSDRRCLAMVVSKVSSEPRLTKGHGSYC